MKTNYYKKRRGDTLLEIIISLFIVALGTASATELVVNATRTNSYSKNTLVALNLAIEGVEAVRNIRDSNWLKYSYDKDHCWNMKPEMISTAPCTLDALIASGNYTVDLDIANMKWYLKASEGILDMVNNPTANYSDFNLKKAKITFNGSDKTMYLSANGMASSTCMIEPDCFIDTTSPSSQFYRMVSVNYDSVHPNTAEQVRVSSIVQWMESGRPQQVEVDTLIANYNRVKVKP